MIHYSKHVKRLRFALLKLLLEGSNANTWKRSNVVKGMWCSLTTTLVSYPPSFTLSFFKTTLLVPSKRFTNVYASYIFCQRKKRVIHILHNCASYALLKPCKPNNITGLLFQHWFFKQLWTHKIVVIRWEFSSLRGNTGESDLPKNTKRKHWWGKMLSNILHFKRAYYPCTTAPKHSSSSQRGLFQNALVVISLLRVNLFIKTCSTVPPSDQ